MRLIPALTLAPLMALTLAPVHLRGGAVVEEPIEKMSLSGVSIGGPAPRTIGWDRVRAVTGESAADADPYMDLADAAWRARTRLDRGDVRGAAAALDRIGDRLEGAEGPTPLLVYETALSVHSRTGDAPAALAAWLQLRRLLHSPVSWSERGLDVSTGLAPAAPPVMTPEHTRRALQTLERTKHPSVARLRDFFAAALSADPSLLPDEPGGDAEELLALIARASAGDETSRQLLVDSIQAVRESARPEPWRVAWIRAASARSLIAQGQQTSEPSLIRAGAAEFLTIPATSPVQTPYLAGLAIAEAAQALDTLGETGAANVLRNELARVSPDHPASNRRKDTDGASAP
jgi:hypothetical protein